MKQTERKAVLTAANGMKVAVTATIEHPDSHYGRAVWVDAEGVAYSEVDNLQPNPLHTLKEIK